MALTDETIRKVEERLAEIYRVAPSKVKVAKGRLFTGGQAVTVDVDLGGGKIFSHATEITDHGIAQLDVDAVVNGVAEYLAKAIDERRS